ncbi:hypothetical protein BMT54_01840 [Pasteurellaceae bacterium 15-036681]|nr:hypothetical protein BMT54_01840 [Pasteurellaceae bacterium 15-036681]
MDKLFQRLTLIFPAWRTALPTDESVAEFKAFWLEELINAKIRNWKLIARGLERCKQSKNPFLPSIGQFIEWCKAVDYHELGLPDEDELLRKIYAFMPFGMENVNEFKFGSNAEYWLIIGYCIKQPCPQDYKYLEAKYVYGLSVYAIAKYEWKKDGSVKFDAWKYRVRESIKSSEWVVAKFLDLAIKNHKNADKLQKFAFKV